MNECLAVYSGLKSTGLNWESAPDAIYVSILQERVRLRGGAKKKKKKISVVQFQAIF